MKFGKLALMSGVAAAAIVTAAGAQAAEQTGAPNLVVAQNFTTSNNSAADLAARVSALEDALAARDERAMSDRTRLSTLEQSYQAASWTFDNGRPTIASGDGRFSMSIRTRFQADFAGYSQEENYRPGFAGPRDLGSGVAMRRAYFGIEGRAYRDFQYEFRINMGGSGVEGAELNKAVISYVGIPGWHFNVGVIEPAFMFEGTTSSANLMFFERPEIDNIAADVFGAGDARRGIEIGWAKTDALWSGDNLAITAVLSGGKTGSSAGHAPGGDEQTQVLGRISDRLWTDGRSNVSIGMSIASVLNSGGGVNSINLQDRPQVRNDPTRLISTGNMAAKTADMIAFDMGGNWENFFLGGEWAQFSVDRQCGTLRNAVCSGNFDIADRPTFEGWYVEGSWVMTGEAKSYTASALNNETGGFQSIVPSRPFSLAGDSWGAWELVARYSSTDMNWNPTQLATATQLAGINGGREDIIALGVNWYLNRNVRVMFQDNIINVKKGIATNLNRDSQNLNVAMVRVQFAN